MNAPRDYTTCIHPAQCQGTDAGGNCRLMRNRPRKDRDCWFNHDAWRQTPEGEADMLAIAKATIAALEQAGLCTNCGHDEATHEAAGRCVWPDEGVDL